MKAELRHKNCGGVIEEDWSKTYAYEDSELPAYRCQKCKMEMVGDSEIDLFDDEGRILDL